MNIVCLFGIIDYRSCADVQERNRRFCGSRLPKLWSRCRVRTDPLTFDLTELSAQLPQLCRVWDCWRGCRLGEESILIPASLHSD